MKIAVLGVGHVHAMGPLVLSLAGFFGERPLDLVFWDPNEERLDLADRAARLAFKGMKNPHHLRSTMDLEEATEEMGATIVTADERAWNAAEGLKIAEGVPTFVFNGAPARLAPSAWPSIEGDEMAVTYQILRWVNGEEYLPVEVENQGDTPLKDWLRALDLR